MIRRRQRALGALALPMPGRAAHAAAIYLMMARDTRSTPAAMAAIVADPDNDWTSTPADVERLAGFMHKIGRMKHQPTSWKDVYMPEAHGLAGS